MANPNSKNSVLAEGPGWKLYQPLSAQQDDEKRDASMLLYFTPDKFPDIEFQLRIWFELLPAGPGHKIEHMYSLEIRVKDPADKSAWRGRQVNSDLDSEIIEKAMAEGLNPVEVVLLKQHDVHDEVCSGWPELQTYFFDLESREIAGEIAKIGSISSGKRGTL